MGAAYARDDLPGDMAAGHAALGGLQCGMATVSRRRYWALNHTGMFSGAMSACHGIGHLVRCAEFKECAGARIGHLEILEWACSQN